MPPHDTIAAIATPPGSGGIGILRVSGPDALVIGEAICGGGIAAGKIQFRRFHDAAGDVIDHGLCLYFKAPHSFSGEDSIELQAHGGPIVLDMLLQRLCELGARLARAGEFSERAFLNGRIDLTQAEAIADLIEAGSRAATRAAMRSLEGRFSDQVKQVVNEVINLRALVEASLDFAEEEIDYLDNDAINQRLETCAGHLQTLLEQAEQGRRLQEGLGVSLAGLPNAGKSSLLNRLAGYEAAIVTEIEGTTRDVLREHISLKGIPLRISDTAGLRESQNPVEKEGVRRARDEIGKADVVIYLVDSTKGLSDADRQNLAGLPADNLQLVFSKADLPSAELTRSADAIYLSTVNGEGMESLIERITGRVIDYNQENQAFMARRRHVDSLRRAREHIRQALLTLTGAHSGELVAEDLRATQDCLNEITGEFTSDDLLGKIFSTFCIGK